MRFLTSACVALVLLLAIGVLALNVSAAVTVTRAELKGGQLLVEGQGAVPNAAISIDGVVRGRADGGGQFEITVNGFSSPTCKITVSDGSTSTTVAVSGCTANLGVTLALLSINPTSVVGGTSSQGTATLTSAAPPGGSVVTLSSSKPSVASVPASVTVLAGTTSASFSISTVSVPSPTSVTISGSFGGVTKPATLSVTPSQGPAAPTGLAPASGASGVVPFTISWSAVTHPSGIIAYNLQGSPSAGINPRVLQASKDPSFPVLTRFQFDNIPATTFAFAIGDSDTGNYNARLYAVTSAGIAGVTSNVITFSVLFTNPLPPPPSPVSPANGVTLTLPVTLTWTNVPNPQPGGYEIQIAKDSAFSAIVDDSPQLNDPARTVLSLTSGSKFWHVRSFQGDASPTTAAVTAWSTTGTFAISSAPPTPVSLTLATNPLFSGDTTFVAVQLTAAAPSGGASIALSTSNPAAAAVPTSVAMPGNIAWTQFQLQAGQVTVATSVTTTATLNGGAASVQFSVLPPSLKSLTLSPSMIS